MDLFRLYRSWLADASARLSANSVRTYSSLVFAWTARTLIDPRTVSGLTLRRQLGEMNPTHAAKLRQALSDVFGFCIRRGLRDDNPLEAVPIRRVNGRRIKRGLTEGELVRLLVALVYIGERGKRFSGERHALMALAHYYTGLRPGEFTGLVASNVHLNGATSQVAVTDTKSGHDRIVPLCEPAIDVFGMLVGGRRGAVAGVGRPRYSEIISVAARAAGLAPEKCRPYALRHTFATHLIERGASIRYVAELLGHVDTRHTMGYTVPAHDELRAAVDLLTRRPSNL